MGWKTSVDMGKRGAMCMRSELVIEDERNGLVFMFIGSMDEGSVVFENGVKLRKCTCLWWLWEM